MPQVVAFCWHCDGRSSSFLADAATHRVGPFISQIIHTISEASPEKATVYVLRSHCHSWASFDNGSVALGPSYVVSLIPGRQLGRSTTSRSALSSAGSQGRDGTGKVTQHTGL